MLNMFKNRYKPNIEWEKKSISYNTFRLWELIFGRKVGIRAEVSVSTYLDENGKQIIVRQFHTVEAGIVHAESTLRSFFSKLKKLQWFDEVKEALKSFRVFVPQTASGFQMPSESPYLFAIAYVGTSTIQDSGSTTTLSVAFSTSGSDRLLTVGTRAYRNPNNTGLVDSVTYNSVAATAVDSGGQTCNQNNGRVYMHYLIAPATGSNTLQVNFNQSGTNGALLGTQYSGAKQTSQPDSSNQNQGIGTSLTASTTVVASDCWLVGVMVSMAGPTSIVAGTGTTERGSSGSPDFFMGDSNGTVGTGSQSMGFTMGNDNYGYIVASFAPAVSTRRVFNIS